MSKRDAHTATARPTTTHAVVERTRRHRPSARDIAALRRDADRWTFVRDHVLGGLSRGDMPYELAKVFFDIIDTKYPTPHDLTDAVDFLMQERVNEAQETKGGTGTVRTVAATRFTSA